MAELNTKCVPCNSCEKPLTKEDAKEFATLLHEDWSLNDDATMLSRRLTFKGFAKAVYTANMAAFLADKSGHHPDVKFGWGYCEINFTTHDIGGLSQNDFVCARNFDEALTKDA